MSKSFDQMTNLYSLSKTLRFELKPVGKTADLIKGDSFFERDIQKDDLYLGMKEKMDSLHRNFIEESMSNIQEFVISQEIMNDFLANKTKEVERHFKGLRINIANSFQGAKELLEKEVIDLLMLSYPDEKENISEFKGFFGYFKTYTQNRVNLYKSESKAGQIAFRLVDENLPRFFKVKQTIEGILEKYSDFIVIEKNEKQQEIEKNILTYLPYFQLDKYHEYLSQSGIDKCNEIIGHINFSINQYKQNTGIKISPLPLLYRLPLAPRKIISWLPQQFNSLEQVHQSINTVIDRMDQRIIPFVNDVFNLKKDYDCNGIFISIKATEQWGMIGLNGWQSLRELTHKSGNHDDSELKDNKFPFISIGSIKKYLNLKQSQGDVYVSVFGEKTFVDDDIRSFGDIFLTFVSDYVESIVDEYRQKQLFYQSDPSKDNAKLLLDASLIIWRFINGFALIHKKQHISVPEKDSNFYDGEFGLDLVIDDPTYPDPIHVIYDKVRNFLTKKPYNNDEKIKVNFDNPTLLDGRDQNKERDNSGVLIRDGEKYYLVLMKKGNNSFFDEEKNPKLYCGDGSEKVQKMIYKLLPGPNKMLPKVIFSKKNMDLFDPSDDILRIRRDETFKQGDNFSLTDLHLWIDFLKHSLTIYEGWKQFSFTFPETRFYTKINEFYHDIEKQGYQIKRKNINKDYLMDYVEKGDLYLFQIYNKDFSEFSIGSENMHTKYFKALFVGGSNNLFKLNGEAEIFWRKAQNINNKGGRISSKHKINIVDKKRYTEDKVMLHLPITLNFCCQENSFNKYINSKITSNSSEFTILGIDRGEKHLLYYSLIKQDGSIIETGSWNVISNTKTGKDINYHAKLDAREKLRDQSQSNRDQQEQIKDLKKGYISQVIHEICNLVIEHNAIIILEDLNGGFKRSRQKVEKNIYQQFELALAKKLNYLVFKNKTDSEPGGTMKGYQLTPYVNQFQDLAFQTGIIFYTAPGYTSTTCPCCGWRKNFYLEYRNETQAKELLGSIKNIQKFDQGRSIEYLSGGNTKTKKEVLSKIFTIYTQNQTRLIYNTKTRQTHGYNMTDEFDKILGVAKDYQEWLRGATIGQLKSLIWSLNLLMKMRNSQTGTDVDLIQCPSCGFDSTNGFQGQPYNGDANGAYNIARKGKLIVDKLAVDGKTNISQIECDNAWMK